MRLEHHLLALTREDLNQVHRAAAQPHVCRLHPVASHAVMNGVPVPAVSCLLGHSNVQMTMRYAHLADRDIEAAAERIGAAMARVMAGEAAVAPEGHAGAFKERPGTSPRQ